MIELIKKWQQDNVVQGMSICIHAHGKEVLNYQSGIIDQVSQLPVNTHTRFTIGSISKLFVTVALLQLEEKGMIDIKKPVYQYLPDFIMEDTRYKQITVEMLLDHSSGLPSVSFRKKYTNRFEPDYIKDVIEMYHTLPLKSDPGKYSVYCNDGFVLAQYLLETVTKMSFRDYCKKYITQVCGMKDTEFPGAVLEEGSYAKATNEYDREFNQEFVNGIGSGGVYSTAKDLCLFYDSFYNGKLLSASSIEKMGQLHAKSHIHSLVNNSNGYGLGFDHVELPCFKAMGYKAMVKSGATFGYLSYGYIVLEPCVSVSVLCTSDDARVTSLAKSLGMDYLKKKQVKSILPIPEPTTNIEGIYGASNRIYRVHLEKDKLFLEILKGNHFELKATLDKSDNEYISHEIILGFRSPKFGFIQENGITYMYVTYADDENKKVEVRTLLAQRIEKENYIGLDLKGEWFLKTNEYLHQRTFFTQDLEMIANVVSKEHNLLCYPFPLKIVSPHKAVPFIELPGNYAREMCELKVIDPYHFILGPYHYQSIDLCEVLPNQVTLLNTDTKWYHYRPIHTVIKDDSVRIVGIKVIDEQAKVAYDSLYCQDIKNKDIDFIGILGEVNSHVEFK